MRVVEAYKLKRQIDQEAFSALALYQTQYNREHDDQASTAPTDSRLTPGLDFYNEYIWTSRGGTQEVKHTYTTTYDEVYNTTSGNTTAWNLNFEVKLDAVAVHHRRHQGRLHQHRQVRGQVQLQHHRHHVVRHHRVVRRHRERHPDALRRQQRRAFRDEEQLDVQPEQSERAESRHRLRRPGLQHRAERVVRRRPADVEQPRRQSDLHAAAARLHVGQRQRHHRRAGTLRSAGQGQAVPNATRSSCSRRRTTPTLSGTRSSIRCGSPTATRPTRLPCATRSSNVSIPWRMLYRVTYCERFLPPISNDAIVVPQITPVMAVPVLDPASDFLFKSITAPGPRPAHNPLNDIEANIVLAAPTASGASAGTIATSGPNNGLPILPNNVIPFDLVKATTPIVNWGDTANAKLLTQLTTSVLGLNTVQMVRAVPGATKLFDVMDPVDGGPLYSVYQDPNGLTVNVPGKAGHHCLSGRERQSDSVLRRQDFPLAAGRLHRDDRRHRDVLHRAALDLRPIVVRLDRRLRSVRASRRRVALLPGLGNERQHDVGADSRPASDRSCRRAATPVSRSRPRSTPAPARNRCRVMCWCRASCSGRT